MRRTPHSHGLPPAPRVSALTQASCLGQAVPRWAVPPPTRSDDSISQGPFRSGLSLFRREGVGLAHETALLG